VKRRPAPLPVEEHVVPPVVEQPEPEEDRRDEHAVDDGGGGEFEHCAATKAKNASKVNLDAFALSGTPEATLALGLWRSRLLGWNGLGRRGLRLWALL